MKTNRIALLFSALFFALASFVHAQSAMDAADIFRKMDDKREVNVQNAVIRGTLDFTELSNRQKVSKSRMGTDEYKSRVEVPLTFRNCTFKGNVIAYKALDKDGKARSSWSGNDEVLYTADFREKVIFENCVFEGKTEFKYSDFNEIAVFNGNRFHSEANFKYANFREDARFEGVDFGDDANFKYANFRAAALFTDARMDDEANFKYAEFNDGASFRKTDFRGDADFKYAQFNRQGDFTNADFRSQPDFKYTKGRRNM